MRMTDDLEGFKSLFKIPKFQSVDEHAQHFEKIAHQILNKTVLVIAGNEYRMLELEFYYTHRDDTSAHYDPFTHKAKLQLEEGHWYFHQMPNGAFKGYCVSDLHLVGHTRVWTLPLGMKMLGEVY